MFIVLMLVSSVFAIPVAAASDSKQGKVTSSPISVDNRLYLPLRATSQLLGLKVSWSQAEQAIYITTSSTSVAASSNNGTRLEVGSTISGTVSGATIFVEGKKIQLTDTDGKYTPPLSFQGSVYLPIRALATSLGLEIAWIYTNQFDTVLDCRKKSFSSIVWS